MTTVQFYLRCTKFTGDTVQPVVFLSHPQPGGWGGGEGGDLAIPYKETRADDHKIAKGPLSYQNLLLWV